jgi:hypothetical protein
MIPENPKIPDWAQQERQADLNWVAQNLDVFWTAATVAFEDVGRGAIVVDTTSEPIPGAGNPFAYFSQERIEERGNEDTQRMVGEYDPTQELVLVLLKSGRISTYRVLASQGTTEDLYISQRGDRMEGWAEQISWGARYLRERDTALAQATEEDMRHLRRVAERAEARGMFPLAQQMHDDADLIQQRLSEQETAVEPRLEPPDIETLMAWEAEGGCEAACPHQCWVEPDGTCTHGNQSWLLRMGLI